MFGLLSAVSHAALVNHAFTLLKLLYFLGKVISDCVTASGRKRDTHSQHVLLMTLPMPGLLREFCAQRVLSCIKRLRNKVSTVGLQVSPIYLCKLRLRLAIRIAKALFKANVELIRLHRCALALFDRLARSLLVEIAVNLGQ
jgi:hypothetical protein